MGYDGQSFIEDLVGHNHLIVHNDAPLVHLQCSAEFDYKPPATPNGLPTIGPVVCRGK
jgi:hypothetical protein